MAYKFCTNIFIKNKPGQRRAGQLVLYINKKTNFWHEPHRVSQLILNI